MSQDRRQATVELVLHEDGPDPEELEELTAKLRRQFANVWGAFAVDGVPAGEPVLLVDDLADSRWTLTVVGAALLEAGSGPISD